MIRWVLPALLVLLVACQFPGAADKEPDGGLQGFSPGGEAAQRAACEERGGRFAKAGLSGGLVCFEDTRDAGKSCTAGSQCDGLCLARSRSCSPIKPLFGCHDILTENGQQTVCID